jgi:16S rRNA (guanine527-N7)-methyltransferase
MSAAPNSLIEDSLKPYAASISEETAGKIGAYISLLLRWNKRISLTTVTDRLEILKFHFGESLFAISEVDFGKSRLADVGSGAGFPGTPIAMAIPSLEVTLIESNSKKCAFLEEVVRELRLPNVRVVRDRMEKVDSRGRPFDFVAARALGHHNELLSWARTNLTAGGKVVLWLGEGDSRAISGKTDWLWDAPRLIPGSERRYILIGAPIR